MNPDADAFLDAIFDKPDDDTHRLVYADWLEEHGQGNYAQFIRLQCAAAREPFWSDEANRLWEEIGRVWMCFYYECWFTRTLNWSWLDAIHFERGLLRPTITVSCDDIEELVDCWAWFPVAELRLNSVTDLPYLAGLPQSDRLRKVSLDLGADWLPVEEIDRCLVEFVRSAYTRRVRMLDLSHVRMRQQMVQSLLLPNSLPGLEELHICFAEHRSDCDPDTTTKQLEARFASVIRHE